MGGTALGHTVKWLLPDFFQRAPLESPLPSTVPAGRVWLLGVTPAATPEIATFNGIELCLAKMTSFIEAFGFLLFLVF